MWFRNSLYRFILSLLPAVIILLSVSAEAEVRMLYFTGGFNGWDISHPLSVAEKEGLFETVIDFSSDPSFKLSTKNPQGSWTTFDQATLYPTGNLRQDEWCAIETRTVSPNIIAPAKRIYTVKVDLDNMRILFSTGVEESNPWSGTLPVMFINTADKAPITSKENYIQATYYLDPMGTEGIEALGSSSEPLAMQIRGRGNYTWTGFDKKPYRIKLDKKAPLLGMEKSKHFALLAHADDSAAGLRNALGFAASETLQLPWTPATAPLEVVLNGEYIGLYWLTETVRVDAHRVNVIEQADDSTTDVDGGWLVEIDNYDSDPHVTIKDSDDHPIWFTYKSPEILSTEQSAYLIEAMQAIQDAVATENEAKAAGLVDFETLGRYFIVNQLMLDMESFHGSCYLYRQRGEQQKWQFGPVWDFGNAFASGRADSPRFIFDRPDFSQVWIGEFYRMPGFVDTVKQIWHSFLANEAGPTALSDALREYTDDIAVAVVYDARRWPQYSHADIAWQASQLEKWLTGSIEWLKKQWGADTEVDSIHTDSLHIHTEGNILFVESASGLSLPLSTIDGRIRTLKIHPGMNHFTLSSGLYLLAGKKILIP